MSEAQVSGVATLSCHPLREGDALVFPYELRNAGGVDLYVFDALQQTDPATRTLFADREAVAVALAPDGFAHMLKGIAPLPTDADVLVRATALAVKLPSGGTLQRRLSIRLPLHETGPYHPDLPIREYRQRDLSGIVLTVEFIAASAPGFSALAVDYAPDLFRLVASDMVASTQAASCRLPARGLSILERTDAFPRPH